VSGELRRILVLVPGALGERLAGPEIRAWEFAKALSEDYEVTLAAKRAAEGERDGIPTIPSTRSRLLRAATHHDAVLSVCIPPYLLALRGSAGLLTIADQYDPHEQELATLAGGRARERKLRVRAAVQALQLRNADVVLCASERQRSELRRVAGELLGDGRSLDPVVVPFGIPESPPRSRERPLRARFPQIAAGDKVVLWWGSVWRWLDAGTAVRAFAQIAAKRPDVKLVITAGKAPDAGAGRLFDTAEQARALARKLGVLDRTVFFYDEWIAYERRHQHLHEADLGLTLHRHAAEARLAARARYMDYLWAELPCVLGRGDQTAEELAAAGFATLLDSPSPDELAATLLSILDDRERLADARAAGQRLAAEYRWSAVGARLRAALASAPPARAPSPKLAVLGEAGAYYARRLADRLVPAGSNG
jgi:glycosyltransferase involved in cell wall biosynthesis